MKIAILVAGGSTGRLLVDQEFDGGHHVRGVVRRCTDVRSQSPNVTAALADVRDVHALELATDGS